MAEISDIGIRNILKERYNTRMESLKSLNFLLSSTIEDNTMIYHPNLDFLNNFGEYIILNNEKLCNIKPINVTGKGKIGTANLIEYNGLRTILKSIDDVKYKGHLSLNVLPKSNILNDVFDNDKSYEYNLSQFYYFGTKFDGIIIIPSDNFSNQTCIHMILNQILEDWNDNFLYQYDAFFCYDGYKFNGYNITELSDKGDLFNYLNKKTLIDDNEIYHIVKQIMTPLAFLKSKKYGFIHGDLKSKNIFVKSFPEGDAFKLADFDKSSIFWNGCRFYNKSHFDIKYLNSGFPITIEDGIKYYYLNSLIPTTVYTMGTPVSIYTSYDVYTLIYSIFRIKKIFNKILEGNLKIMELFMTELFGVKQYQIIYQKMIEDINNNVSEDVLQSIYYITEDMKNMNIKLKININSFYDVLNLNSPDYFDKNFGKYNELLPNPGNNNYFRLSYDSLINLLSSYHICTSNCKNGTCETNKYNAGNNTAYC